MTDNDHAEKIRQLVKELNAAIADAVSDSLRAEIEIRYAQRVGKSERPIISVNVSRPL